jgi:hypothetical protein
MTTFTTPSVPQQAYNPGDVGAGMVNVVIPTCVAANLVGQEPISNW